MGEHVITVSEARRCVEDAKKNGITYLLTSREVIGLLKALIAGTLEMDMASQWAEFFDVNEDVELEHEVLADVLFELSSPEINGVPDEIRLRHLIDIINRGGL